MHNSKSIKIPFRGQSMWPLLNGNEILLVDFPDKPIQLTPKDIGSLFIFKDNVEWVCHRYLGSKEQKHVFKGDFSTTSEFIDSPHVLGRVWGFETANHKTAQLNKNILDIFISSLQLRFISSQWAWKKIFRYQALVLLYLRKSFLRLK